MKREYGVVEVKHYRVFAGKQTRHYTKFIEIVDGYAKVMKNDRWGVLDNKGNEICPLKYKYVGDLINGMMIIYDGIHYGYFSKETNTVLPCIFENAYPFVNDTAQVVYNGIERVINKNYDFVD